MRIADTTSPQQVDLETRRAVAELQRVARSNAGQAETLDRLVLGLFGAPGNTVRPIALIKRSTANTLSNLTDTIETFDQPLVDTDSMWSVDLPDRLIIQTPGVYIAAGQANYTASGTGHRVVDVLALGTHPINNVVGGNSDAGIAGGPNLMQAWSAPIPLDAGSELYLNLWQSSGGPLATLTTYGGTWIAAIYLQPLP